VEDHPALLATGVSRVFTSEMKLDDVVSEVAEALR
jgi:methylmalonyl-CoA mutase cobalamin-binding subunit